MTDKPTYPDRLILPPEAFDGFNKYTNIFGKEHVCVGDDYVEFVRKDAIREAVKIKPIVWDWIGNTHAFGGGGELLLTRFTAPKDRLMWRVRVPGVRDFHWLEGDDLEAGKTMITEQYEALILGKLL